MQASWPRPRRRMRDWVPDLAGGCCRWWAQPLPPSMFLFSGWWWLKPAAFILIPYLLQLHRGCGVWPGESPARRWPMLTTATPVGAVTLLKAWSWPSPCLPLPLMPGETLGPVHRTRRRRRQGVVIFLKTSSRPSRRDRCGFRSLGLVMCCRWWPRPKACASGAQCTTWQMLRSMSSPSPSRPCLLLADSSRRMRGGTLVWVALEPRSSRCCLAWFVTRS